MSYRRFAFLSLIFAALALAGCKIDSINYFPPQPANVRAANFMIDIPSVDVTANGNALVQNVLQQTASGYAGVDNQPTTFAFLLSGTTTTLLSTQLNLAGKQNYTLLAYGTAEGPNLMQLPDAQTPPNSGSVELRFANIAAVFSSVDIYVTLPTDTIDTINPTFVALSYGASTNYLTVPSGARRIRVTTQGTKIVIYDSGATSFAGGASNDLIVYGIGSAQLVTLASLGVNGGAPNVLIPSTVATFKIINAAPDVASLNTFLDGTASVAGTAYPSATAYVATSAATHTFSFESAATPGAALTALTATLAPASDYSIFVNGTAGSYTATALPDTYIPTITTRVRYVNASANTPAVQFLANDVVQATSVATNTASLYVPIVPSNYTITGKDPATGATLFTTPLTVFTAGQSITVYAVGSAGALSGLVVVDR